MVQQRLPTVNGDDGVWGDILNQFLQKEHYDTGSDNAANGGHKTITIRAGTATAGTAPLKFTSGTLLSSPEAGAMEFNSNTLYFTITTGTIRKTIAMYDDSSGATGDIYYRDSSGNFSRLGIGSTGDVLKVSGGLPSWGPGSGGSPGGSTKQIQYNNGGSFAGASGFEYQSASAPNVKITAQGDYNALLLKGSPSQSAAVFRIESDDGLSYMDVLPGGLQMNGDIAVVREAVDTLAMNGRLHIVAGATQTTPKLDINGSTSGTASVVAAAVAGTPTLTLPTSTGTLENVRKGTRVDTTGTVSLDDADVVCLDRKSVV